MGIAKWIQRFVAVGILAAGVGGGWLMSDDRLAWEIHLELDTNTEDSFGAAKERLFNEVDREPDDTILCRYSATVVDLVEDDGRLGPDPDAGVQVEHTWASQASWAPQGDRFPRDSVPGADLHHLFAVRQGINASRGNHPFGELPETARELSVKVNGSLAAAGEGTPSGSFRDENSGGVTVFEPRDDHKGDVARAMFYMSVRYWMAIPDDMEDDLRTWHVADPAGDDETTRNDKIEGIQGNRNPFVDFSDLAERISDF
jgi:endonuclease I